jgi:hypothetical protein
VNRIVFTYPEPHSIFQMPFLSPVGGKSAEEDAEKVSSKVLSLCYRKISDYAARQITYNSDRFPAIAEFGEGSRSTYRVSISGWIVVRGCPWRFALECSFFRGRC